ncbi:MAG: CDP-alcohol phosphatidyltransferase family protein [Clostridia bacterium]|jgi:cardiolipin synthase|nr:CDP-alcohol phosphatidyltransferase family protein [Clostridia bacterium]
MKRKEIFSIPNLLSFLRILLIPFFIAIYVSADNSKDYYLATLIIILSGMTDFIDGFIARRFHMITEFGKIIDPIADKLTQAAIVVTLMNQIRFMYVIMIIFVVKEVTVGMVSLRLLKQGKKLEGAMWFGKISTAVFYMITIIIIAFPTIEIWIIDIMLTIILTFLVFSFVMYMKVLLKMKKDKILKP